MRPYDFCINRGSLYVVSPESAHYKRYIRVNRVYKLASPDVKFDRLYKQNLKLRKTRAELAIKKTRLRKQ
jgi:hypothetical protein